MTLQQFIDWIQEEARKNSVPLTTEIWYIDFQPDPENFEIDKDLGVGIW